MRRASVSACSRCCRRAAGRAACARWRARILAWRSARGPAGWGLRGARARRPHPRRAAADADAAPAVPGMAAPVKALCLAPFGMEEGTEVELPGAEFGLVVGEPAEFRLFGSSVRRDDRS